MVTDVVAQRCSIKKVFLEISKNSQENTFATEYFFKIKLQAQACNFIEKETLAQVIFAKFLRTPIFTVNLWWLLMW